MKTEIYWDKQLRSQNRHCFDHLLNQHAGHAEINDLSNLKPDTINLILFGQIPSKTLKKIASKLKEKEYNNDILMVDHPPFFNTDEAMKKMAQYIECNIFYPLGNSPLESRIDDKKISLKFGDLDRSAQFKLVKADGQAYDQGKEIEIHHDARIQEISSALGKPRATNRGDIPEPIGLFHKLGTPQIERAARLAAENRADSAAARANSSANLWQRTDQVGEEKNTEQRPPTGLRRR